MRPSYPHDTKAYGDLAASTVEDRSVGGARTYHQEVAAQAQRGTQRVHTGEDLAIQPPT